MLLLASILVVLGCIAFVAAPLLRGTAAPLTDGPDLAAELRELYALRDVTYETIRDLDFDFHSGKIDASDYRELMARYKLDALDAVRRIEAAEARLPAGRRPPSARP